MHRIYQYYCQARCPTTYMALFLGLSAVYVAEQITAPSLIQWLLVIYHIVLFLYLLRNPSAGLRLSPERLELFRDLEMIRAFPLARIARVKVSKGIFTPVRCTVFLTDGTYARIDPHCLPPAKRLRAALQSFGIEVF